MRIEIICDIFILINDGGFSGGLWCYFEEEMFSVQVMGSAELIPKQNSGRPDLESYRL